MKTFRSYHSFHCLSICHGQTLRLYWFICISCVGVCVCRCVCVGAYVWLGLSWRGIDFSKSGFILAIKKKELQRQWISRYNWKPSLSYCCNSYCVSEQHTVGSSRCVKEPEKAIMYCFSLKKDLEEEAGGVNTGLPRGHALCLGWDHQWTLAVSWGSFSSSRLYRAASYSVMFLGHIALLCLLFSSCAAVLNELFSVFLFAVAACVCVCVSPQSTSTWITQQPSCWCWSHYCMKDGWKTQMQETAVAFFYFILF